MYKASNGLDYIFIKDVVVDPHGCYWFVEEFTHKMGEEPVAKCRNGCSYVSWKVKELEGVM